MSPDTIFSISNLTAMFMWALMILLPNWKVTQKLIDLKLVPIILSLMYLIYISISILNGGGMDFSSLTSVMELFTKENSVLAGWIHYLAFDLLIGMWILNENKTLGIHHGIIVPCLLGTLMLGPVGFLVFLLVKTIKRK